MARFGAVLLLLIGSLAAPATAQPAPCQYVLGFAQLSALIPDIVGPCVDDETHGDNGDALQQSVSGLLVWRKFDNWTAFTDGGQSWVNGPLGLQRRMNTQRFWWEANPAQLAIVPPPAAGERCHTAGLSLALLNTDAGAGNLVGTFALTNLLDVPCTFYGYPGAQLLDAQQDPLPTTVVRGGAYFSRDPAPATVTVPPHQAGTVRVHWAQVPVGNEPSCSESSFVALTPPDEYVALVSPAMIRACGGGTLEVSAMQPPLAAAP